MIEINGYIIGDNPLGLKTGDIVEIQSDCINGLPGTMNVKLRNDLDTTKAFSSNGIEFTKSDCSFRVLYKDIEKLK